MSTRAMFTFVSGNEIYHVYKRSDGDPPWAAYFIEKSKEKAWSLPRFAADDFSAAFIAANKSGGGGVYLSPAKDVEDFPSDIEFRYEISVKPGGRDLNVMAFAAGHEKGKWTKIFSGALANMIKKFPR